MIKLQKLTKIFTTDEIETTAINAIDLHIKKGEFVAIKGPSGCGKTTLMNILGLMDVHSDGEYHLLDQPVHQMSEVERTRLRKGKIGFVFQKFNLIDSLNVYENIELPLHYLKIDSSERKQRIETALDRLNIKHRAKHFPSQLSGGQQQRVAVARCIVAEPDLILADEPTGNLDSTNGKEVMEILSELHKEGKTIIMVTHDDKYAHFADRIINLYDGNIVSE
ncbi:MAG: ABC transporter ATP-binding protein [Candidatus Cloacimonetes bacterium]|nr:ABC transporter ATP-binding protein [Candidatus Cloacimonadota bacterium]HPM00773.1 ABC transporter ATP-binding protein [Candidatus Cloacimonadota bacterium]